MNKYQKGKATARAAAIDWQLDFCNHSYSYAELFDFQVHFTRLARRYGLIREFKENAII